MGSLLMSASVVLGLSVWIESSLTNVFPTTPPGTTDTIALRAARGEWESVQVCVRAGDKDTGPVHIEAAGLDGVIPEPDVYVVDYVTLPPTAERFGRLRIPDRLLPYTPQEMTPGQTIAFWLTYKVPRDTTPGTRRGAVHVRTDTGSVTIDVSLEVFGFSLPEMSSLRGLFPLNRGRIREYFGLENDPLADWTAVYDNLAPYRLAFSVWDEAAVLPRGTDQSVQTDVMQDHLAYAVAAASMNTIDVGAGLAGIGPFAASEAGALVPPLRVHLYDMGHWLRRQGWFSRAVVIPGAPARREDWPAAREASFRVYGAAPQLARVMPAPLHPFFERYLGIWAISLPEYNYYAAQRLQSGQSLRAFRPVRVDMVEASGSSPGVAGAAYETRPEDAFDGSFFTHWVSGLDAGERYPWLRVDFDAPIATDAVEIGWVPGWEAESVRVRISHDGRTFNNARVSWSSRPAADAFQPSWSVGRLRGARQVQGLRLEFRDQPPDRPVAIADLLIAPAVEESAAPIEPVNVWLRTRPGQFPSLSLPAHPAEPRVLPWVCWSHGFTGMLHTGTANWPAGWASGPMEFPAGWPTEEVLVYPGVEQILPSIRLMRLRDGLEDYEYMQALNQMLRAFHVREGDIVNLKQHPLYLAEPTLAEIQRYGRELLERRDRLATAMNNLLKD
jgi:hypothetical protein